MIRIQRPSVPTTSTRKERLQILRKMQHDKCCYCEQKIIEAGNSPLPSSRRWEHFRPKSLFPELKEVWENQLLACKKCNEDHKANKFPVICEIDGGQFKIIDLPSSPDDSDLKRLPSAIIDPSDPAIDPEDHIGFEFIKDESGEYDNIIRALHASILGEQTITMIKLGKKYYRDERYFYLNEIVIPHYYQLLKALYEGDVPQLHNAKQAFSQLMSAAEKFAALVRAFARYKKLDQSINLNIPVGIEI